MNIENNLAKGRIADILAALRMLNKTDDVEKLSEDIKLSVLLTSLQLSLASFDKLLANNSPVLRTIKGHAFEVVFKRILAFEGISAIDIGGDQNVDLVVNNITLQLKTPYSAGSKGNIVQFKTHKTHGAKSENESMSYYQTVDEFPDYLVGLISYEPFKIIFISKAELPRHPKSSNHILSPFSVDWAEHEGLNNFGRIGLDNWAFDSTLFFPTNMDIEQLPLTVNKLNLTTNIILDTILVESNFRIWDMNIRGFAREVAIHQLFNANNITFYSPLNIGKERADKSDFALKNTEGTFVFFQVKGASVNYCIFNGYASSVSVETQLTRGRVNDHPTQSRLYLKSDFDYLIICLDPPLTKLFNSELNGTQALYWRFFCIPTNELAEHHVFTNRLKSVQTFKMRDIGKYEISTDFFKQY